MMPVRFLVRKAAQKRTGTINARHARIVGRALGEDIVPAGGGLVVIDDGAWVDGQRSHVEDAAV
jgi:hypothetical protein